MGFRFSGNTAENKGHKRNGRTEALLYKLELKQDKQHADRQTRLKVLSAALITTLQQGNTRPHHTDEIPERDVTYHLTCLLIYH